MRGGLFIILHIRYSIAQSPEVGGGLGFLSGKSHCSGPTRGRGLRGLPAAFSLAARRGTGALFGVEAALGAGAGAALGSSPAALLLGLLLRFRFRSSTASVLFVASAGYRSFLLVGRTWADRSGGVCHLRIKTQKSLVVLRFF